ncbi:hypothetical protein GCM10008949_46570 [Deinococcus humi]|nr:hypothetical protein GCM10008949_46570 [Deinococcus humi]
MAFGSLVGFDQLKVAFNVKLSPAAGVVRRGGSETGTGTPLNAGKPPAAPGIFKTNPTGGAASDWTEER